MTHFEILGKFRSKQRPRFYKGVVYTAKETVMYENYVTLCFMSSKTKQFHSGAIKAVIDFYFEIPKSVSKKDRELIALGKKRPTIKPDCDNLAKIILDSLNHIAYKDDSMIVELTVRKFYGNQYKAVVNLEDL